MKQGKFSDIVLNWEVIFPIRDGIEYANAIDDFRFIGEQGANLCSDPGSLGLRQRMFDSTQRVAG